MLATLYSRGVVYTGGRNVDSLGWDFSQRPAAPCWLLRAKQGETNEGGREKKREKVLKGSAA